MRVEDKTKFNDGQQGTDDLFEFNEDADFNFGELPPDEIILLDEEITEPAESAGQMDFVCPLCAGIVGAAIAQVPEAGLVSVCPSCTKKIHIIRESSACRARQKPFGMNCAHCGKPLGKQAHCHSCGVLFPDFFVAIDPDAARRKARSEYYSKKWAAIKEFNLSFKPALEGRSKDAAPVRYAPGRAGTAATGKSAMATRTFAVRAFFLIAAVALIVGGIFAYRSHKAGQVYADNYIKALYCIKTGVDTNIRTCASWKSEWESAGVSGRSPALRISGKDEAKTARLRGEIDKYMQTLSEPPKKFVQANDSLVKMHAIYLTSERLVKSKPTSPQMLGTSIENLTKTMGQATQTLKATLPELLKRELAAAKLKYRGLQDF